MRLGGGTELEVQRLDDQRVSLRLHSGAAALRVALERALRDPALIEDARRSGLPLRHLGAARIERLLDDVYNAPREVVARAMAASEAWRMLIASISAGTLMLIAAYSEQPRVAIVAAAIGGSALGFLRHNYNPAKIFMGTGGAYVLGFMLAAISIVGALKTAAAFSLFIPVLVFGVPIMDAFIVIIRRQRFT